MGIRSGSISRARSTVGALRAAGGARYRSAEARTPANQPVRAGVAAAPPVRPAFGSFHETATSADGSRESPG
jgi:hypothetical protein